MARDEAASRLKIAEGGLPADALAAAQERGREQTFEAMVEHFLATGGRTTDGAMAEL